ncbi:alpha/beta family hydrolase [Solibacillus isronensis]|uniref:alpha/beta family hydrolase n=1 Tax=Solibacillus isronensis TaxID=412383 RepID=UPI002040B706|nr:alpha/beta family hydrolase [Solibacillus isronensis]MCM3721392.1 alpha/beta hydrolase [Solibacillus isronensis]
MFKVKTDFIKGYKGKDIDYTVLSTDEHASKLAILLPGAGYTAQAPLLHYSTGVFSHKSVDVLQVNYTYNDKFYDSFTMDELVEAIKHDVGTVIDKVLEENSYDGYYLVGKSLGTIAMASLLDKEIFHNAKAVWLTPLLNRDDVFESMLHSRNESLCFIGDDDTHYNAERYRQFANNPKLVSRLLEGADHSLQYKGDPVRSIDLLKTVIKEIDEF